MGTGGCGQCHPMFLLLIASLGRAPHTLPLLQHGVPPMGDSFTNFSIVCASPGLQFFMNCSSTGPTQSHIVQSFRNQLLQQGHISCQQTCSSGLLSPRAQRSCQSLLQHGFPGGHGLGTSLCSGVARSWGAGDLCSLMDLPGHSSPWSGNAGCRAISALTPCPMASCHSGRTAGNTVICCGLLKHFWFLPHSPGDPFPLGGSVLPTLLLGACSASVHRAGQSLR